MFDRRAAPGCPVLLQKEQSVAEDRRGAVVGSRDNPGEFVIESCS